MTDDIAQCVAVARLRPLHLRQRPPTSWSTAACSAAASYTPHQEGLKQVKAALGI